MSWSVDDFIRFQALHTAEIREIRGTTWSYYDIRPLNPRHTFVFLHGTTGSKDIFWKQILFLKNDYRVICFDLPPVTGAEELVQGIFEILNMCAIEGRIILVGTSFGGYLAQIFAQQHREDVSKLVLANTFRITDYYYKKYHLLLKFQQVIPFFLVKRIINQSLLTIEHYATRQYLLDYIDRILTKKLLISRLKSFITDKTLETVDIEKILIIETVDDPLVPKELQEDLKQIYPHAQVKTFDKSASHFPYLTRDHKYSQMLLEFSQI